MAADCNFKRCRSFCINVVLVPLFGAPLKPVGIHVGLENTFGDSKSSQRWFEEPKQRDSAFLLVQMTRFGSVQCDMVVPRFLKENSFWQAKRLQYATTGIPQNLCHPRQLSSFTITYGTLRFFYYVWNSAKPRPLSLHHAYSSRACTVKHSFQSWKFSTVPGAPT